MTRVLERGDVFFFFKPRIGATAVRSLDDVARFFFILDRDGMGAERMVIVGRKRLPDLDSHERAWSLVTEVADRPEKLRDRVRSRVYQTKTRGLRVEPAAQPVGEGRYLLADHDGHSHFAYELELPPEPGEVQQMFGVHRDASFVIALRNPDAPAPPGTGLPRSRRAYLPPEVKERFRGRRWLAIDDASLLDYSGVELVLIGARRDAEDELGIELDTEAETVASSELLHELDVRPDVLVHRH